MQLVVFCFPLRLYLYLERSFVPPAQLGIASSLSARGYDQKKLNIKGKSRMFENSPATQKGWAIPSALWPWVTL